MSREFLQHLPPELAAVYDKPAEPNPMAVRFQTLKKVEDLKERTRANSNLYKIFGENMFGYTTIDGALNLSIRMFDIVDFQKAALKIVNTLTTMVNGLKAIGDGVTQGKVALPSGDVVEGNIRFKADQVIDRLSEEMDAVAEAVIDVTKNSTFAAAYDFGALNETPPECIRKAVEICSSGERFGPLVPPTSYYVNREKQEQLMQVEKMFSSFDRQPTDMEHLYYFRHTVVKKVLDRSIRAIHWSRELG